MLGRFRMTVQDCLDEYENLVSEIFGNPRYLNKMRLGIAGRDKYSTKKLEKVFKNFVLRRCEHAEGEIGYNFHFPSRRKLCKT